MEDKNSAWLKYARELPYCSTVCRITSLRFIVQVVQNLVYDDTVERAPVVW